MTDNEDGGRRNTSSYMEQENEWERESLLDPAWEIQQKKVCFTSFMLFLVHTDGKQPTEATDSVRTPPRGDPRGGVLTLSVASVGYFRARSTGQ